MLQSFSIGIALALVHFGCPLGQQPASTAKPGGPQLATERVVNEVDTSNGHLTAEVNLDGETTAVFNLDTYALYPACLDEKFAARMGFERVGSVMNTDGSGTFKERDVVLVPELRWGGATFYDVRALVDDYSWVPAPGGGHIEGLMGYPLFKELLLEIDYPAKRVTLSKGEVAKKGPHVLASKVLKTQPDIPLKIGETSFVVGIDTGAVSGLMLPLDQAESLSLVAPAEVVGRAQTVYGSEDVLRGTLVLPMRWAGHSRTEEPVTFSKLFGKPLIGHELLQHYVVTFDQRHGRVQFEAPKK